MELYVKVSFWLSAFALFCILLSLAFADMPVKVQRSAAQHVVHAVIHACFLLWGAQVLGWI